MFCEKNVLFATTWHLLLTVSLAVPWRCFALNGKNMWKMLGCSNYSVNVHPIFLKFASCLRVLLNWSVLCLKNPCYSARNMGEYHLKKIKNIKTETLKQRGTFIRKCKYFTSWPLLRKTWDFNISTVSQHLLNLLGTLQWLYRQLKAFSKILFSTCKR